ncbi:MFS general substrate transporter [Myriangium duriaei CBS 260.36]|uniref:MFS general substrate transporter n=1 Tax=Myriangium duriaei CBS 260.36 TaxID=1168546 RepID=A0A9P4JA65_9PEZI|nr:MFS general substrate transporter [Myriangium duriaei CBS 260.36]
MVGCFFLMFNSWGLVNAYGTFLSYYREKLFSGSALYLFNLIGSTQSFVVLFLSFVVGRLLDAGHTRYLTIAGTVLTTLGCFLISVVNGKGGPGEGAYSLTWLVQGLVLGLGMACFFVTSSQVVGTHFRARKGFAIGCVASGASAAGLIYPVMLRYLIEIYGFNNAVRFVTLLCFLLNLVAVGLARPHPTFPIRRPDSWKSWNAWVDPSAGRNMPFILFTAAIAMMFFGFYGIFFNLEEWAAHRGVGFKGANPPPCPLDGTNCIKPLKTYWLLAMMNGASSIGRLSSSYLCDRFGALNVHASVTLVASCLCIFLWPFANTVPSAIAFVLLFGAFSGSVIGLPPASMAAILGPSREAQAKLGHWTGMMYTVAAPFALTGPFIEGWFIKRYNYNYLTIQMFSGGCLMTAALLMVAARLMSCPKRRDSVVSTIYRVKSVSKDSVMELARYGRWESR